MTILNRKLLRELKTSKLRSSLIIIALGLSIAIYAGFMLGYKNIEASFDLSEEETNYEDFRVSFSNYTAIANITSPEITTVIDNIAEYDYRIWQPSALKVEGEATEFTAYIHGVPGDRRPIVNDVYMQKGEYFTSDNATEVLVETHFAKAQDLDLGDTIEIFSGEGFVEYTIVGIIWSPEYTYVTNRLTMLPDWENLGAVWMPIKQTQALFGFGDVFNELLVKVENKELIDTTINSIIDEYQTENTIVSATKKEDEPDTYMKNADVGFMDDMSIIFGLMVLIIAIFVLYDTISKVVESQRNYIGVMSSLGGNKWKIVFHYVKFGTLLGVISSVVGVIFALLLSYEFMHAYTDILQLPITDTDYGGALPYFGIAIGVGLLITVVVSFLSALKAASITPREAMSSAYVQQVYTKKPLPERVLTKVPGFKSLAIRIPIRGIMRNKRRSLLTFITYGLSMLIVFGSLGFVNSFMHQMDYYYNDIEKQDISVYLVNPINQTELNEGLLELDQVIKAETFVNGYVQISVPETNKTRSTEVYGYDNPTLRSFNMKDDSVIEPGNYIYLGSILAKFLDVEKGSEVEIGDTTFEVGGILQELMDQTAFLHYETAQELLGLEGLSTGALVEVSDVNLAKVEILESGLPVAFLIVKSEIYDAFMTMMQAVIGIIFIVIFVGLLVVALFSFNTVVMDVMSREMEFVNFRTLGAKKRTLYKVIGAQGLIIAFLGSLAAIPIGYLGVRWFNTIVEEMMYIQTKINLSSFLITIATGLVASFIG
ncbi:MAG: FtsX-like permease family protein, partial [Candidatus Heimdallarchaeota archaeon]|nr:FtsX-like permease family protein [Candidatus Heimdallarchaeota archaeon]MCK5049260.1 FtsX-like permease family protein [Candidatus Heimdallarchaeota archaeon]